jgi:hypothetical protein
MLECREIKKLAEQFR